MGISMKKTYEKPMFTKRARLSAVTAAQPLSGDSQAPE
jgi:hypothetical protein